MNPIHAQKKPTEREHAKPKRYAGFDFFFASGMILIKGQFRDGK